MNDYLSDDEQVEALKRWWAENGKFIIAGIALGIAGLFGWNRYQANLERTARDASAIYERLLAAADSGDSDLAIASQDELIRDYGSTPYAEQARLALAKLHMDNGQPEMARAALQALIDADPDGDLAPVARLRLARILLYLERPDEASAALDGGDPGNFLARYDELRGDIAIARSDAEAARLAYQSAIENAGSPPLIDLQLVQMKLADLGPGARGPAPGSQSNADTPQ